MTDWISKSAEVRFKLPFEEAIAARLSMEDAEWAFYEPFSIAIGGRGGRPASDRRRIPDAVFRIARTGSPWRDPPEEFGVWSSVYRRFRRRMPAGLWETTPEALNESGAMPGSGSNDRLSSMPIIWRRTGAAAVQSPAAPSRNYSARIASLGLLREYAGRHLLVLVSHFHMRKSQSLNPTSDKRGADTL